MNSNLNDTDAMIHTATERLVDLLGDQFTLFYARQVLGETSFALIDQMFRAGLIERIDGTSPQRYRIRAKRKPAPILNQSRN